MEKSDSDALRSHPWAVRHGSLCKLLEVDAERGLTETEAVKRLGRSGANVISHVEHPAWRQIVEPFTEPMMVLLLVTVGLFAVLGDGVDAIALLIIMCIMVSVEVYQERNIENSLRSL